MTLTILSNAWEARNGEKCLCARPQWGSVGLVIWGFTPPTSYPLKNHDLIYSVFREVAVPFVQGSLPYVSSVLSSAVSSLSLYLGMIFSLSVLFLSYSMFLAIDILL